MYEPEADQVKVADFGIAPITDSSKAKTEMVLGPPSYMCTEQLCGTLPFGGDSMAQLMFKIANEPAPDILSINANVPAAPVAFLDKGLAKDPDQRCQTGEEFAAALRQAMAGTVPGAAGMDTMPMIPEVNRGAE